jgi:hypothetical protein
MDVVEEGSALYVIVMSLMIDDIKGLEKEEIDALLKALYVVIKDQGYNINVDEIRRLRDKAHDIVDRLHIYLLR